MQNIINYETKEIECDRCGWVGTVAKHIPLKQSWCGGCRSSRIRLHKRLLTQVAVDVADSWWCKCGAANHGDETNCYRCNSPRH